MSSLESRIEALEKKRGIGSEVSYTDNQMIRMYACVLNRLNKYKKKTHKQVTKIAQKRFDSDTKQFKPGLGV
ncbi:MAG: hypothetical protein KAJ03_11795 [Gammaproteobacteria bacterium]|nr:hypothetical protein [Gammaproteobacteria bacterium]